MAIPAPFVPVGRRPAAQGTGAQRQAARRPHRWRPRPPGCARATPRRAPCGLPSHPHRQGERGEGVGAETVPKQAIELGRVGVGAHQPADLDDEPGEPDLNVRTWTERSASPVRGSCTGLGAVVPARSGATPGPEEAGPASRWIRSAGCERSIERIAVRSRSLCRAVWRAVERADSPCLGERRPPPLGAGRSGIRRVRARPAARRACRQPRWARCSRPSRGPPNRP